MHSRISLAAAFLIFCFVGLVDGQTPTQIVQPVDESATVTLVGNVHPLVAAAAASKLVDPATLLQHMVLHLKGSAAQEAQLEHFITQLNDPKSPLYHQYLSPQDFSSQYGVTQADIAKVTAWLESHGFSVEQIPSGSRTVVFSGNAAQVENAFKTEIRQYTIAGVAHYSNSNDPQIPAALAGVVGGVVTLHDFRRTTHLSKGAALTPAQLANPLLTYGSSHYLSPADYSTIYDINPLYNASINGTGQSIAVLARSDISLSDVQSFRSTFGLKANDPQFVVTNHNPGIQSGDNEETTLDTEWSGAVAPNATVKVIISASSNTSDGIDLSALYAVNNNVASVVSLSYGSCEADMGSTELAFYNSLWKQAAAQGQTVLVAAGDSGAAACDYGGVATQGRAINGLCSSPYATCVGGTQFVEGNNPGQYWLPGNNPVYGSAISYLPETVWNESGSNGGSGLWAGGGGASAVYAKPSWQTGPGVPADSKRDVPDVSLTASSHDAYLVNIYGQLYLISGTSAAAPSFAGLMALVDQKTGARQGLANSILYPLASKQGSGGAAVFHDVVTGNNTVPGVTGFSATTGYDLASGLGSVDANVLVNHWTDATSTPPSLAINATPASLTVIVGQSGQATVLAVATAINSAVKMSVTGAPSGLTATLASTTIASPGSGSVILKVAASVACIPGSYTLTVTGTGGNQTAKATITVVIPAPTFTLSTGTTSLTAVAGNSAQIVVSATPRNGFNSSVALAVTGLPAGVTGTFSTPTIGVAGGSSALALSLAKTAKAGSYPFTITAKGDNVIQTHSLTLTVTVPASCMLAVNPTTSTALAGLLLPMQISCGSVQGTFGGPLALSISGAPSGITAQLASSALIPGSVTTLNVSSAPTMASAQFNLSLTASGSGFAQTVAIPVSIVAVKSFSISATPATISINQGSAGQVTAASTVINGYNGPVSLSVTGLPAGVTASLSKSLLAAPGSGTSLVTFTVASNAKPGTYSIFLSGAGSGIAKTAPITLTIPTSPPFSFAVNASTLTLKQGTVGTIVTSTGNYAAGFNGQISMSFSGLAPGMNWAVTAANASSNHVNISDTVSTSSSTPVGTYPVTISATGGGFTQSVTVHVSVTK